VPSLPSELMKTTPSGRGCIEYIADIAAVAHVVTIDADTNNVMGRSDVDAGIKTQGGIAVAGGVGVERISTDGRVVGAGGVFIKRTKTVGRIVVGGVAIERSVTVCSVEKPGGVGVERVNAIGAVVATTNIAE
jgi:hypothetical protein